ncbi:MAG: response regulator [Tepidisphaeraceae bacterium]|jgi:DNA-binding response OmpR family regulator
MQKTKAVLVVEDDEALNEVVCRYVSMAGYEVCSALDGSAALQSARENSLRLVLLDLMLPDTTGYDICQLLKADERTRGVPIVMVTALNDDASRRRCLACGASAYLTKPFDPDCLIQTIRRWAA